MAEVHTFEKADFQQVKSDLHKKILDRLDLEKLGRGAGEAVRSEVLTVIRNSIAAEAVPLSFTERERLSRDILDEIFGFGPLEVLLKDPTISDILVNRCDQIYIERAGRLEKTQLAFKDNAHLMQIIDRIVSQVGRRIDESSPMVDARLQDGSRVHAIIPPLALDSPTITIRKFPKKRIIVEDLVKFGSLTDPMAKFLRVCVLAQKNMIISGGTGSGKTTLLNVL